MKKHRLNFFFKYIFFANKNCPIKSKMTNRYYATVPRSEKREAKRAAWSQSALSYQDRSEKRAGQKREEKRAWSQSALSYQDRSEKHGGPGPRHLERARRRSKQRAAVTAYSSLTSKQANSHSQHCLPKQAEKKPYNNDDLSS